MGWQTIHLLSTMIQQKQRKNNAGRKPDDVMLMLKMRTPPKMISGPVRKNSASIGVHSGKPDSIDQEIHMNSHWYLRAPFAAVFLYHGMGKLLMPAMSAEMLSLPVALVLLVGLAEILAGTGVIAGGIASIPKAELITRLSGLASAPVLLGAIAMVHFPRWSFVPTETHPMGGMEFQVVLLGLAIYFIVSPPQSR